MNIDFNAQGGLRFRNGRIGRYLGVCPLTGKHRVSGVTDSIRIETTALYPDTGICRVDGAEGPSDIVGEAA